MTDPLELTYPELTLLADWIDTRMNVLNRSDRTPHEEAESILLKNLEPRVLAALPEPEDQRLVLSDEELVLVKRWLAGEEEIWTCLQGLKARVLDEVRARATA